MPGAAGSGRIALCLEDPCHLAAEGSRRFVEVVVGTPATVNCDAAERS